MLQIKKNAKFVSCTYNLQILFRRKNLTKSYTLKKTLTQTIHLRSPKHFNIGKQKITNLNFKSINLKLLKLSPFFMTSFFRDSTLLYSALKKSIKTTPTLFVSSVHCLVKTSFKLKWLVISF